MISYKVFLDYLTKSNDDTGDFWENFDSTHRFLSRADPAYVEAQRECAHKTAVLFDDLCEAHNAIAEVHFYLVMDYINLTSRFQYAFGQTLALLEWVSPQTVDGLLNTLDERREAFDSSPDARTIRHQAKVSYRSLRKLYAGLNRETQLTETLTAYERSKQITDRFLPFAGYATQRLRLLGGTPNLLTPLAKKLIALYEKSK